MTQEETKLRVIISPHVTLQSSFVCLEAQFRLCGELREVPLKPKVLSSLAKVTQLQLSTSSLRVMI